MPIYPSNQLARDSQIFQDQSSSILQFHHEPKPNSPHLFLHNTSQQSIDNPTMQTADDQKTQNNEDVWKIFFHDPESGNAICQICDSFVIKAGEFTDEKSHRKHGNLINHMHKHHHKDKQRRQSKFYSYHQSYSNSDNILPKDKKTKKVRKLVQPNPLPQYPNSKHNTCSSHLHSLKFRTLNGLRFKRSAVWNFISVKNNKQSRYGLCKICQKDIYRGTSSSTTPFWRHLHRQHQDVINQKLGPDHVKENNGRTPKKQLGYQLSSQQMSMNEFQESKVVELEDQILPIKKISQNTHDNPQQFSNLIDRLHIQNPNILIYTDTSHKMASIFVQTQLMKIKLHQYSHSILIVCKQTNNFESIISILGQNENGAPVLFGIGLVGKGQNKENNKCIKWIIQSFLRVGQAEAIKFPNSFLLIGPQTLETFLQEDPISLEYQTTENGTVTHYKIWLHIKLPNSILYYNEKSQIEECLAKTIKVINSRINAKSIQFIGQMLTYNYVRAIVSVIQRPQSFQEKELDRAMGQIMDERCLQKIQTSIRKIYEDNLNNYKNYWKSEPFLYKISQFVSPCILYKLTLSFLYADCLKTVEINKNMFTSHQINNIWSFQDPNYLRYDSIAKRWRCNCSLEQLSGLPCPHLINLMKHHCDKTKIVFKIWKYVSTVWFTTQDYEQCEAQMIKESNKAEEPINQQRAGQQKFPYEFFLSSFWE